MIEYLVENALAFAAERHKGQLRKIKSKPYIFHLIEVSLIASTITDDSEVLAATILHDVLEDTKTNADEVREKFGERVVSLILSETENKYPELPKSETWLRRKQESLDVLKNTDDIGVKILWLSDKLSNIRSCYNDYLEEGDEVFKHFHQSDKKLHEWYYRTVAENVSELSDTSVYKEYVEILNKIF